MIENNIMTREKKIKIWIFTLKTGLGGGGLCGFELAKALERSGQHIRVVCKRGSEIHFESTKMGYDTLALGLENQSVFRNILFSKKSFFELRTALSSDCPDLVVVPMSSPLHIFCLSLFRKSKVKYFTLLHEPVLRRGNYGVNGFIAHAMQKIEIKKSDFFFTLSDFAKIQSTADGYPSKCDAVVHPVFESHLHKSSGLLEDGSRKILFFGRDVPSKGLRRLVDSFSILQQRANYRVNLILCLNGPVRTLPFAQSGIELVFGYQDSNTLVRRIIESDVVALPYENATQSGVIALSLGVGCPCVVTPVGGLPEQVIDGLNGAVAVDMSPEAFADALNRCLADSKVYASLLENIRVDNQKRLNWDRLSARVINRFFEH